MRLAAQTFQEHPNEAFLIDQQIFFLQRIYNLFLNPYLDSLRPPNFLN